MGRKGGKPNVISARGLKLSDRVCYNEVYYIAYSYNPKGVNFQCKPSLQAHSVIFACYQIQVWSDSTFLVLIKGKAGPRGEISQVCYRAEHTLQHG